MDHQPAPMVSLQQQSSDGLMGSLPIVVCTFVVSLAIAANCDLLDTAMVVRGGAKFPPFFLFLLLVLSHGIDVRDKGVLIMPTDGRIDGCVYLSCSIGNLLCLAVITGLGMYIISKVFN
ncbi:hypothetical protein ABZP36_030763 [Zizania latifolia]